MVIFAHHAYSTATENWKSQVLPLARIKKIMKSEEGILSDLEKEKAVSGDPSSVSSGGQRFMIAGEAPVLLGKACELFVREVTMRAWRHTERNRRRTLQRQDVHAAVGESEVYDFLIDIVPRVAPTTSGKSYASADPPGGKGFAAADPPPPAPAISEPSIPPSLPSAAAGGKTESGMSLADAEMRLQQLQQMQEQYIIMHQTMQADAASVATIGGAGAAAGPGQPMPPQQMVMGAYGIQAAPEQAAQWAVQAMRIQQLKASTPPDHGEQKGDPTVKELT